MSSNLRLRWPAFVALLAGAALAGPARGDDAPPMRSLAAPFFSADVAVSIDSLAHPSVVVTVTLPYTELSWNRVAGGFAAGAAFAVELAPAREERLYGGAWEKRLLLSSYPATRSGRNTLVAARTFDVPPGRYRVRVRVRDVSSEREATAQDQLVLEDLQSSPLGFSDLELGVADSAGAFTPVPTRVFGFDSDRLAARVAAFDHRPGAWPRQADLHYRVVDGAGNAVVQGDTSVTLAQASQSLVLRPVAAELFIGDYSLELERAEGKSRWRTSRRFEVEESGPPRGHAYTVLLEALAYVAPPEEVEGLRQRREDAQEEAWERFWRRRDPTPETARNEYQIEFFRRLRHAEQHFQGFGPGWRSDMGRIYIRYGPPDQVEQRAANTTSPALEIWYYGQPGRRFVFVDREGFGRFTLVSPAGE